MLAAMKRLFPLAAFTSLAATPLMAQTVQTWNTAIAGSNWSVNGNWSPANSPAGNDLVFGQVGVTSGSATVGNIVDTSYTVNSVTYNNIGTVGSVWQVTQINSGVTLTINSVAGPAPATIFSVGGVSGSSSRVSIRGSGTLAIDEATSSIYVGGPTSGQTTILDMSGLGAFTANVATVNFGGDNSRATGDVSLANSNSITANTINIGTSTNSTSSSVASDLILGQSNIIYADTINVGKNYGGGTISYRAGLTSPTTVIRGTAGGSSRTDLNVGAFASVFGINNAKTGVVDFSGGSVDAMIDQLTVGTRNEASANVSGVTTASFIMDAGTVNVNSVTLGQTVYTSGTPGSIGSLTATIDVKGGNFQVNSGVNMAENTSGPIPVTANFNVSGSANVTIAGNVVAGAKSGSAATVAANVNISGGTLLIQGNLTEGAGGATSTVNLSGGTLNMDHGAIAVDSFNFTGGTLRDVASFSAGITGGLNVQNASTLAFGLDGGFVTLDLTGTLTLGASSNLQLTLANGFTPGASYTLVGNDLSDLTTGAFATINGTAFGVGNTFSLTNDQGTFQYQLTYTGGTGNDIVIQAVPEPSVALCFGLGASAMLLFRRRSRVC
jgi:hypothetical protein